MKVKSIGQIHSLDGYVYFWFQINDDIYGVVKNKSGSIDILDYEGYCIKDCEYEADLIRTYEEVVK